MSKKSYGEADLFDSAYDDRHDQKYWSRKSCYHDHPVLLLGGGKFIGGSCSTPVNKDADVYIGFDSGMRVQAIKPWERQVVQVYHHITDMHAPSKPEEFKQLVNWTAEQLKLGKTVHAGCIGGHGRTGTFLAALLSVVEGEKDAIAKARKVYCEKAVESSEQIKFLEIHFGIIPVTPSKGGKSWGAVVPFNSKPISSGKNWSPSTFMGKDSKAKNVTTFQGAEREWKPVKAKSLVWETLF
jgi:hypothetical protein